MDEDKLSNELQALVGRCMILEAEFRKLGDTASVTALEEARRSLVAVARRLEPPPDTQLPR